MSATQLSFSLNTSKSVKTVHLLGSWDGYKGQLPLSKDSSKPGKWKGTFRFGAATLKPGQRYWYYYHVDGYHPAHDPNVNYTTCQQTRRKLNVLDIPPARSTMVPGSTLSKRSSTQYPLEPAKGRSLSPSKIISPKPSKPYESRRVREADYSTSPGIDDLASQLEHTSLYKYRDVSPPSSVGSSLSSRSTDRSSPESLSSLSSGSSCRCNRWGVTRSGGRVKLDCKGSRCGSGSEDSSSACSSIDSGSEDSEEEVRPRYREELPRYQEIQPRGSLATSRGSIATSGSSGRSGKSRR